MFIVDLDKAFDRVPRRMFEWVMRKKGIPDVLVRSVMSLYKGAKASVSVDFELSEEIWVKMLMLQGSLLSLFLFTVVMDNVSELARGVLFELL